MTHKTNHSEVEGIKLASQVTRDRWINEIRYQVLQECCPCKLKHVLLRKRLEFGNSFYAMANQSLPLGSSLRTSTGQVSPEQPTLVPVERDILSRDQPKSSAASMRHVERDQTPEKPKEAPRKVCWRESLRKHGDEDSQSVAASVLDDATLGDAISVYSATSCSSQETTVTEYTINSHHYEQGGSMRTGDFPLALVGENRSPPSRANRKGEPGRNQVTFSQLVQHMRTPNNVSELRRSETVPMRAPPQRVPERHAHFYGAGVNSGGLDNAFPALDPYERNRTPPQYQQAALKSRTRTSEAHGQELLHNVSFGSGGDVHYHFHGPGQGERSTTHQADWRLGVNGAAASPTPLALPGGSPAVVSTHDSSFASPADVDREMLTLMEVA